MLQSCLNFLYSAWDCSAGQSAFSTLYATGLRGPLFTGFLTLSSFLLAANTFIVINMKNDVYGSSTYAALLEDMRKLNPNLSHYGPLMRLSGLLFFAIICAFITSSLQLTLGLLDANLPAAICLTSAFVTIGVVMVSLYHVRRNIVCWLEQAEKESMAARKAG